MISKEICQKNITTGNLRRTTITTIACNNEELYGDLQYTNNNTGGKWKGKTKVYRFDSTELYSEPFFVGFSGSANDVISIVHYWSNPEAFGNKPPKVSGCAGLVLTQSGDIFLFDHYAKWLRVDQPYMAIGSGQSYALGAMAAGKSPREAIRIASKHDSYTGMGIKGYSRNV